MSDDVPNNPIAYRPPKDKRGAYNAMREESGLSHSAFITECVFGKTRHRPAENRKLAQILFEEQKQTDILRSLEARLDDDPKLHERFDALLREKIHIRTTLMSLLGRRS